MAPHNVQIKECERLASNRSLFIVFHCQWPFKGQCKHNALVWVTLGLLDQTCRNQWDAEKLFVLPFPVIWHICNVQLSS